MNLNLGSSLKFLHNLADNIAQNEIEKLNQKRCFAMQMNVAWLRLAFALAQPFGLAYVCLFLFPVVMRRISIIKADIATFCERHQCRTTAQPHHLRAPLLVFNF